MREIEPHVAGIRALWSPRTGDHRLRAASASGWPTTSGRRVARSGSASRSPGSGTRAGERVVATAAGEHRAPQRDRVRRAAVGPARGRPAVPADVRIMPFRGDYYSLRPRRATSSAGLIYPVPDPRFPFLGVHLTRRIDGEVWAGPNAVLAFAREGYRRRDVEPARPGRRGPYRGFWKLARRHWRTGVVRVLARLSRSPPSSREIQRYVPAVAADDIVFGPSGIRGAGAGDRRATWSTTSCSTRRPR